MSERTSYAPGTPSWVDLGTPDTSAAAAFYGAIFGWDTAIDPRPEAGGYGMFSLKDQLVAGLGPQMNPDLPPFWAVYVTVADAAAALAQAEENGGTVVMGPQEIFDAGHMGVIQDPVGSFISVWQPVGHIGCQLANEPGTFTWSELATTDLPTASTFYMNVFGWGLDGENSNESSAIFMVDGEIVCGAHTAGPGELPAWSVWFAVADTDATTATVVEQGGTVIMPPDDMSFGRGSVVADPQGAVFGLANTRETA